MPLQRSADLLARARALVPLPGEPTQPVYLVGGAVRDLLLGLDPIDVDLAVEGPVGKLADALGGAVESHDRFTTATVVSDGRRYDLAQTRTESYGHPGALPDVRPATITEDLRRRDFTVNAIALSLARPQAGELLSVDGALSDLDGRRLEVLHDTSFEDDPTRLLRLARYQARLGFVIGQRTRDLAGAAVALGALNTISGTRIGNELRLLAGEPDPVAALTALHALALDTAIDPAFSFDSDHQALATLALSALPSDGRADLLVLAAAFVDQPADRVAALLHRLAVPAVDRDAITEAADSARALAARVATADTGAEVAHAVGTAGVETVALASAYVPPDRVQWWLQDLRHRQLEISGADLRAAGIPEGPRLGAGLEAARDAMLDGKATDRESQLNVALTFAE